MKNLILWVIFLKNLSFRYLSLHFKNLLCRCYLKSMLFILFIALTFFVGGCNVYPTKEQKERIDSILIGKMCGDLVNERIIELWNENYCPQLEESAYFIKEQYEKEYNKVYNADMIFNGIISDLQPFLGKSYNDIYREKINSLNQKVKQIENSFNDISRKIGDALAEDFYTTKEHINDLYSVYNDEKSFSDLGEWVNSSEFAQITTTFILPDNSFYSKDNGIMVSNVEDIDLRNVYLKCMMNESTSIDCTLEYAYTVIYYHLVNTLFDIDKVYFVKAENTKNSYIVGYSNMQAFLCTIMKNGDDESLVYESIEFNQTLIGQGI